MFHNQGYPCEIPEGRSSDTAGRPNLGTQRSSKGLARRVFDFSRMEISKSRAHSESRYGRGIWETQKGERMSLTLTWGLGFLPMIVVWYICHLRHPGTGQNKDSVPVSIISH